MVTFILKQKQILLFIGAGALSAVVEIGLMKILSFTLPEFLPWETNWHGIAYPLSNIFSTAGGILSNYFLSIWFVFEQGKHSKKREFSYFMILSVLSTICSLFIFNILYQRWITSPVNLLVYTLSPVIASKALAIIGISILNFSVKKRFIFNN